MLLLLVVVLGGFVWYVLNPDERAKILRLVPGAVVVARRAAAKRGPAAPDPFADALRARTRWTIVAPCLAAANVVLFVWMLSTSGAAGDSETLVAWGGNFGPRTSNGEWGRLLVSAFVHSGPLHLLVNVVALVQLGLILERLVGSLAFAAVYFAAAVFASLASLVTHPVHVGVGASGAVLGLYGLLIASAFWSLLRRSPVTPPLAIVKTVGPVALVFGLYNAASGSLPSSSEWTGLAVGLVLGLGLTREVSVGTPSLRRLAAAAAVACVIAAAGTIPLRGIADVRPEIQRIIAAEDRITSAYDRAVGQFRLGALSARQLAQLIDRTIVPEVKAAQLRLKALAGVPAEHAGLIASAEEYLRLRGESWRLRSEALRTASMPALGAADKSERASLRALDRMKEQLPVSGSQLPVSSS